MPRPADETRPYRERANLAAGLLRRRHLLRLTYRLLQMGRRRRRDDHAG
jgi:hypothetical protein